MEYFARFEMLIGADGIDKLLSKKVVVVGIGGVGSFAAEALARSAIGTIVLVDKDIVDITNINRQILALHSTIGKNKVDVMKERLLDINPKLNVKTYHLHLDQSNLHMIIEEKPDYIIDAIDSLDSKVSLILAANQANIPIISSMGMANKWDPTRIEVTDIAKTHTDPVAKILRKELKNAGFMNKLKVVFSSELPLKQPLSQGKKVPASNAFVPPVAGIILANTVVRELLNFS